MLPSSVNKKNVEMFSVLTLLPSLTAKLCLWLFSFHNLTVYKLIFCVFLLGSVKYVAQLHAMWLFWGIQSSATSGVKQTTQLLCKHHKLKPGGFGKAIGFSTFFWLAWYLPLSFPGCFTSTSLADIWCTWPSIKLQRHYSKHVGKI
jgi:hypothetical protein